MREITVELLKKIEYYGYKAYAVGGFPRDLYIDRSSTDIDICTNATPQEINRIFNIKQSSFNKYGSVTVYYKNNRFEITTFRKEIKYQNNRVPVKIKYINSLMEDLKRRDFSINTLCLTSDNEIIDLLNAKEDIDGKIINVVGNSKKKIKEDSLRILRAIRFATVLGFKLSDELEKAIKKYRKNLIKLSYYRKKEELNKIFSNVNAEYGINLIKKLKLTSYLGLKNLENIKLTSSSIGIWAQLDVEEGYPFTYNEKIIIKKIKYLINKDILEKYTLYVNDLYELLIVAEIKGINKEKLISEYNNLKINTRKEINITALDICTILNKKEGSFLKEIFNQLEIEILHGNLENKREDIIEFVIQKYYK